jgi:hypothetical protein
MTAAPNVHRHAFNAEELPIHGFLHRRTCTKPMPERARGVGRLVSVGRNPGYQADLPLGPVPGRRGGLGNGRRPGIAVVAAIQVRG